MKNNSVIKVDFKKRQRKASIYSKENFIKVLLSLGLFIIICSYIWSCAKLLK